MKHSLTAAQYRAIQNKKRNSKNTLEKLFEKMYNEQHPQIVGASKVKKEKDWTYTPDPREVNYPEDLEGLTEGERKLKEL